MNEFPMPVTLIGAMTFQPDQGGRINQLYVINSDAGNDMYRGYVPAKMTCDQIVVDSLPKDPAQYPMTVTLTVRNRTKAGSTVQHAVGIMREPAKKAG